MPPKPNKIVVACFGTQPGANWWYVRRIFHDGTVIKADFLDCKDEFSGADAAWMQGRTWLREYGGEIPGGIQEVHFYPDLCPKTTPQDTIPPEAANNQH